MKLLLNNYNQEYEINGITDPCKFNLVSLGPSNLT